MARKAVRSESRHAWAAVCIGFVLMVGVFVGVIVQRENERAASIRAEREAAERAEEQRRREADLAELRRQQVEQQMREVEAQKYRNTIQYVDSFQSTGRGADDRTDAQRKASWDREFGGQWVRWEGIVITVTGRGDTCSVSLRVNPKTMTSDTGFDLDRATAVALNEGQRIRVEGRLVDHSAFGYKLSDVRVVARW